MKSLKNFVNERLKINKNTEVDQFKKEGHTLYRFFEWYFDIEDWDKEENKEEMLEILEESMFYLIDDGEFDDYDEMLEYFIENSHQEIKIKQKDLGNVIELSFKVNKLNISLDCVLDSAKKFSWNIIDKKK